MDTYSDPNRGALCKHFAAGFNTLSEPCDLGTEVKLTTLFTHM